MSGRALLLTAMVLLITRPECAVSVTVNFTRTQTCPSSATLAQLTRLEGAVDTRACFVECALTLNCSVVFRSSLGVCYFGTAQQLATQFSPVNVPGTDPCLSHVRNSELPSVTNVLTSPNLQLTTPAAVSAPTPAAAVATPAIGGSVVIPAALQSKLIIFFDFRQGYTNLANPLKYNAAPHGSVSQTSTGVNFPGGSTSDYIEIDTDGRTLVPNYLAHTKKFTFYANLYRQTSQSHQSYHYFYDCTTPGSNLGEFYDSGENLIIKHMFPSSGANGNAYVSQISTTAVYSGSTLQYASVGAMFNGASLSGFYSRGNPVISESNGGSFSGAPLCLRLGYYSSSSGALKGRYVCYAIANDTLTVAELTQLQTMCT